MKKLLIAIPLALLALLAFNPNTDKIKLLQARIDSLQRVRSAGENLGQAVLWFQRSPEMQASYLQSYGVAKTALVRNIARKSFPKRKSAVVVDIDETILNNAPYEGWLYLNDKGYEEDSWNKWVLAASAEPLPGAADFLAYAHSKGCEVFYVSNRKVGPQFDATVKNLQKYHLPDADAKHVLLKSQGDTTAEGKSTKQKRRMRIEKELGYEIVLLAGDQLGDFDASLEVGKTSTPEQIKAVVEAQKTKFGTKYFLIPNPMYSDWLNFVVSGNDRNRGVAHVDSVRRGR